MTLSTTQNANGLLLAAATSGLAPVDGKGVRSLREPGCRLRVLPYNVKLWLIVGISTRVLVSLSANLRMAVSSPCTR